MWISAMQEASTSVANVSCSAIIMSANAVLSLSRVHSSKALSHQGNQKRRICAERRTNARHLVKPSKQRLRGLGSLIWVTVL